MVGIIGMGESYDDVVSMAFDLQELGVQSIPLNFLNAIEGTPLQGNDELSPNDCLRALAMFRFVNPDRELRISGGRELHLRSLQPTGALRGKQFVCRGLPHHRRASSRRRLSNDQGPGV